MRRIGIVGCGGIARVHAWVLSQLDDIKITALCDIVPEHAQGFKEEWNLKDAQIFSNLEDMLLQGNLDGIHICAPHVCHVPMAVLTLQKGLDVFMEKPVAISTEQLKLLQRIEAASSAHLGICFQNRYNTSTRKLDELVASGHYGKVLGGKASVTWRRDENYYAGSPWKGKWETEGGGALINQSIHTLDLLLRYLGEPTKIEATIANHHTSEAIEVEDTVEAWLEFPDGKRGCFYASNGYVTDAPISLELQCEKARLLLTENKIFIFENSKVQMIPCEENEGIGKSYWGVGHLSCIRDFYECIIQGKKFPNDLQSAMNTTTVALEIYHEGRKTLWNR